jgi:hypothetical protein
MQKDDSSLTVLPSVQAILSIVSSLTRKRGARSLGENEFFGSFRVTTSLPNTPQHFPSTLVFCIVSFLKPLSPEDRREAQRSGDSGFNLKRAF